jgi:hypothetical protein
MTLFSLIDNDKSKSKKDSGSKSDSSPAKTSESHEYDELGHDMSQIGENITVKRKQVGQGNQG